MDNHIERREPVKPPILNFGRVLCFILSGAGLIIAAFAAFVDRSVGELLILTLVFGIPFLMALTAVPRSWFSAADETDVTADVNGSQNVPWWRRKVDYEYSVFGKRPFGTLTKADYAVLLAMLAASIILVPSGMPVVLHAANNQINLGDEVFAVAFSVLLAAYFWQLRLTSKVGWWSVVFLIFLGISTSERSRTLHDARGLEGGMVFLYVGMWSFVRLTIRAALGRRSTEDNS